MTGRERIALIDADSLLYYSTYSQDNVELSMEELIAETQKRINQMVIDSNSDHYILFMSKSRTFRHSVAQTKPYKGNRNRNTLRPPKFYGLQAYLNNIAFVYDGLEADDNVLIFQHLIKKYYLELNINTIICSPDKDVLNQAIGLHFNYGKSTIVETSEEDALKFLFKQCLMGDTTDNIQGVPGIGDKKADKLLEGVFTKNYIHVTLRTYMENFDFPESIYKFAENFRLVYLLRNEQDLFRELGIEFTKEAFELLLFGDEILKVPPILHKISNW